MSSSGIFTIHVTNLETKISVGIYEFERTPQRVIVNAQIEGEFPLKPQSVADCFNYEHVHSRVVKDWPARGHTDLLETLVVDLLQHIFSVDARVTRVKVHIAKPDIFAEAESVGVEAQWTRADFEK